MNDQTNVEKIAYANTPQTTRPDYISDFTSGIDTFLFLEKAWGRSYY
jgi:hypothetical protein